MKKIVLSIIILVIACSVTVAQIPNNGFENWTNMGTYNNPDNWDNLNSMTAPFSVYTCTKGTPGNPGASYLKLVSKMVGTMGVMPGIATTGIINIGNMSVTGGFAFNQRPQSLTGSWQYMLSGSDTGFAAVYLTKWNVMMGMRDTVAKARQLLAGMGAMSWTAFTINLTYMSGGNPDTAQIILSSSGMTPAANSYLYADDLAFAGSVAGISENKMQSEVKLFPNPVSDKLTINFTASKITEGQIEIYNSLGEKVKSIPANLSSSKTIDVAELSSGHYILKFVTSENTFSSKFLKQ